MPTVLITLPLRLTVSRCVLVLTVMKWASPMRNLRTTSATPYVSFADLTPARWALNVIFWFAFQYFLVRKITVELLTQYQAPWLAYWDVTRRDFSTALRSPTGRLNVIVIGMPMPTLSPLPGLTLRIDRALAAFKVLNLLVALVVLPAGLPAAAV